MVDKGNLARDRQWIMHSGLVMIGDALLIGAAFGFALLMRFDFLFGEIPHEYVVGYELSILPLIVSVIAIMWWRGLYRSIWSFVSVSELIRLIEAWAIEGALICVAALSFAPRMPASFWIGGSLLSFVLTAALRLSYRLFRILVNSRERRDELKRVMVVGSGEAGRALIREMNVTPGLHMRPVCAIDDSPAKLGRLINGVPVVGGRYDIAACAKKYETDVIVVAIPSATGTQRKEIVELCQATGLDVRVVPSIFQLVGGEVSVSELREIRIEDLLGRDSVLVDGSGIHVLVAGKSVLVTGGGGSIGSEICRQVASEGPATLVIFDVYENNAYAIQRELWRTYPDLNLVTLIGSVRDEERVRAVYDVFRPDVVFHAAAHKHVPLMEDSPLEAIKNNVFGTLNCARAALEYGTDRFVLISTDKAVNPTNVMGASKRLCEMIVQAEARKATREGAVTTFSAVRFGNVLGSNGSVVPLFEKQ
ncbi:MAG: SDR family NAD(P)-dependent oxidoreductase, partial [Coriobacteriales bacterium]|nr:SDR family NAD(P)-dependent oxidoreductase [Coriobacteriales bacterium]